MAETQDGTGKDEKAAVVAAIEPTTTTTDPSKVKNKKIICFKKNRCVHGRNRKNDRVRKNEYNNIDAVRHGFLKGKQYQKTAGVAMRIERRPSLKKIKRKPT